jgi:hypothetical protein
MISRGRSVCFFHQHIGAAQHLPTSWGPNRRSTSPYPTDSRYLALSNHDASIHWIGERRLNQISRTAQSIVRPLAPGQPARYLIAIPMGLPNPRRSCSRGLHNGDGACVSARTSCAPSPPFPLPVTGFDITPTMSRETRARPGRGTGGARPPEDGNAARSLPHTTRAVAVHLPARSGCAAA